MICYVEIIIAMQILGINEKENGTPNTYTNEMIFKNIENVFL
jgi:hypothetical protein